MRGLEEEGDDRVAMFEVLDAGKCSLFWIERAPAPDGHDHVTWLEHHVNHGHVADDIGVASVIDCDISLSDLDNPTRRCSSGIAESAD